MKIVKFNRWQTMLHILPQLKTVSDDLFNDAVNSEPYEVLLRRFGALVENIRELSIQTHHVVDLPERDKDLVTVFDKLSLDAQQRYSESLNSEYSELIHNISEIHTFVVSFVESIEELKHYVYDNRNKETSPFAAYAY